MSAMDLIILACATWYVTTVVTSSDGPWAIFWKFRKIVPMGGLTSCPKCLSIWVAVILLLLYSLGIQAVVVSLGVAGGALMLGSYSGATYANNLHSEESS